MRVLKPIAGYSRIENEKGHLIGSLTKKGRTWKVILYGECVSTQPTWEMAEAYAYTRSPAILITRTDGTPAT